MHVRSLMRFWPCVGWLEVPAKTHQKYLERFQRRGVETTVFNDTWYHADIEGRAHPPSNVSA
jgi:hypothetical protein